MQFYKYFVFHFLALKLAYSVSEKLNHTAQVVNCKKEIILRCDPKRIPNVENDLANVSRLRAEVKQVAKDSYGNTSQVYELSAKTYQFLNPPRTYLLQNKQVNHEVANLCKNTFVNVTNSGPCSEPLVKKALQSYFD